MRTIVWDVDDVLNNLMAEWFEKGWLREHPECCLRYDELKENPPHRILAIREEEYLASLDRFRHSNIANLAPVPEVAAWFASHGFRFRHCVLTSTTLDCAKLSAYWVVQHFGKWVRSFHFIPAKRSGQDIFYYDETKGEMLNWLGNADIFIDDSPVNVEAATKRGIRSMLVAKPWNKGTALSDILRELTQI